MSLKSAFVQLAWTFFIASTSIFISFAVVWPSYALEDLESDASPLGFKLIKYQSNLVGSIPMIGSLIATLVAGSVCDGIGRKKTLVLASLGFGVSWSLILTARSLAQILIGRFMIGLSSGIAGVVTYVYVGEITQIQFRGVATPILSLVYTVGILMSYLLGWFCSYDVICYICVSIKVVHIMVIVVFMKDSPAYLLSIGQEKSALASLKYYRGETVTTDAILEELSCLKDLCCKGHNETELMKSTEDEKQNLKTEAEVTKTFQENENPWKLIVSVEYNRRTAIITMCTMALATSMGMVAIQTYAGKFFTRAVPSLSPDLCSVILAVGFVVSCILTTFVTNMVSRRFLMISSCIVASICLATLGSLLRWSWGPVWLIPVIVAVYVVVFHLGPINLAFLQMSECFGPQVNSTGTSLVICTMFLSNFTVLFLFVPAVDLLGIDGTFFVFAALGVITTIYSILFIRETRNVPVEKIQRMFARGFLCNRSDLL